MEAELLDALYSYAVLAASRTFAAGDAFLILNDLYGGPGLTLCPTSLPKIRSRAPSAPSTPLLSAAARAVPSYPQAQGILALQAQLAQQMDAQLQWQKVQTDSLMAITSSGVKVVLKDRYGLFIAAQMEDCTNIDTLQPLMRFECVTTTLLLLSQTPIGPKFIVTDTRAEKQEECGRLFQNLISNPEQICHRAVTIEPYS